MDFLNFTHIFQVAVWCSEKSYQPDNSPRHWAEEAIKTGLLNGDSKGNEIGWDEFEQIVYSVQTALMESRSMNKALGLLSVKKDKQTSLKRQVDEAIDLAFSKKGRNVDYEQGRWEFLLIIRNVDDTLFSLEVAQRLVGESATPSVEAKIHRKCTVRNALIPAVTEIVKERWKVDCHVDSLKSKYKAKVDYASRAVDFLFSIPPTSDLPRDDLVNILCSICKQAKTKNGWLRCDNSGCREWHRLPVGFPNTLKGDYKFYCTYYDAQCITTAPQGERRKYNDDLNDLLEKLENARKDHAAEQQKLSDLKNEMESLKEEHELQKGEVRKYNDDLNEMAEKLENARKDHAAEKQKLSDVKNEMESLRKEHELQKTGNVASRENALGELEDIRNRLEEKKREESAAQKELEDIRNRLEEKKREESSALKKLEDIRNRLEEKQREESSALKKLEDIDNRLEEKKREESTAQKELEDIRNSVEEVKREKSTALKELEDIDNRLEEKKRELSEFGEMMGTDPSDLAEIESMVDGEPMRGLMDGYNPDAISATLQPGFFPSDGARQPTLSKILLSKEVMCDLVSTHKSDIQPGVCPWCAEDLGVAADLLGNINNLPDSEKNKILTHDRKSECFFWSLRVNDTFYGKNFETRKMSSKPSSIGNVPFGNVPFGPGIVDRRMQLPPLALSHCGFGPGIVDGQMPTSFFPLPIGSSGLLPAGLQMVAPPHPTIKAEAKSDVAVPKQEKRRAAGTQGEARPRKAAKSTNDASIRWFVYRVIRSSNLKSGRNVCKNECFVTVKDVSNKAALKSKLEQIFDRAKTNDLNKFDFALSRASMVKMKRFVEEKDIFDPLDIKQGWKRDLGLHFVDAVGNLVLQAVDAWDGKDWADIDKIRLVNDVNVSLFSYYHFYYASIFYGSEVIDQLIPERDTTMENYFKGSKGVRKSSTVTIIKGSARHSLFRKRIIVPCLGRLSTAEKEVHRHKKPLFEWIVRPGNKSVLVTADIATSYPYWMADHWHCGDTACLEQVCSLKHWCRMCRKVYCTDKHLVQDPTGSGSYVCDPCARVQGVQENVSGRQL